MSRRGSSIRRDDDIADQLMELKGVTQELGTLHEAQKQQLLIWGKCAFTYADRFELAVGLPHMDGDRVVNQHSVEYRVQATKAPPRNLKRVMNGLARSVHWLLGNEFCVSVKVNGTAIFVQRGARPKRRNVKQLLERLKDADAKRKEQRERDAVSDRS